MLTTRRSTQSFDNSIDLSMLALRHTLIKQNHYYGFISCSCLCPAMTHLWKWFNGCLSKPILVHNVGGTPGLVEGVPAVSQLNDIGAYL